MKASPFIKTREYSDEEYTSDEVVDTWEDLLEESDDTGPVVELTKEEKEKQAKEKLQRNSDLDAAADLFGVTVNKDPSPNPPVNYAESGAKEFPEDLAKSIDMVARNIRNSKTHDDKCMFLNILKKLFLEPGKDVPKESFDKLVSLLEEIMRETENDRLQVKPEKNKQAKSTPTNVKDPKPIVNENKQTPAKNTGKKNYPNLGASKKKYKKLSIEDDIVATDDIYDDMD